MPKLLANGRPEAKGRRSSNKEVGDLIQKARAQGWSVLHTGSGHYVFRSPDKTKPQVIVPSTPGGGNRSLQNARALLKKSGLVMNPYYHATRADFARQILEERKLRAHPARKYGGRPAVFAGDTRSSTMGDAALSWSDSKHSLHFGAHPEDENVLIEFEADEPDDRRGPHGHEAVWFHDVELRDPKIVTRRPGRMVWNGGDVAARFMRLVNMTPSQIRAWAKDPRSRCYSFASTRARLPALAKLRAKPVSEWTAKDYAFARRVVSFNTRMLGAKRRDGCRDGYTVSLRNWGHDPRCKLPVSCKSKRSSMKRNKRRVRRNPQVSYGLIAIGIAGVAALAWWASRPAVPTTPALAANQNAAAAVAAQREPEIVRMMARDPRLTRAEAAARYDRAVGAVFAAASTIAAGLRPTSGMGSYYRT